MALFFSFSAGVRYAALAVGTLLGAGGLACAQTARAPAQGGVPTKDVIASLVVDFDQDGVADRLVFTPTEGSGPFATLHVFKGSKDAVSGKTELRLLSKTEEFGFGVFSAEEPRKGIITIESANAQGRYKWEQKLTLAWRGGQLVVLGITYASYDSISGKEDHDMSRCDLNLATGKGTDKRLRPVKVSLKPVPVAQWTDEKRPAVCE